MFGGAWKKSRTPIGVDVGARCVRLMQLERSASGLAVVAAGQHCLPDDLKPADAHAAVSESIAKLLASGDFRGRRCVSCLPAAAVQYKNLRLPRMPDDELAQAVKWEAQDRLQLSADAMAIGHFDAGEVRQADEARREVILLAAPHAFVERHTRALVDAGLEPAAIDVVPSALRRTLATFEHAAAPAVAASAEGADPVDGGVATVAVDIGYSGSKILVARDGRTLFFKFIPVGGRRFDEAVAAALNLPVAEAATLRRQLAAGAGDSAAVRSTSIASALRMPIVELGRELSLCLRYYGVTFRGRRPDALLLVGGEAGTPGLAEMLGDSVGTPARPFDPLRSTDCSAVPHLAAPAARAAWATAFGLALRDDRAAAPAAAGLAKLRKAVAA